MLPALAASALTLDDKTDMRHFTQKLVHMLAPNIGELWPQGLKSPGCAVHTLRKDIAIATHCLYDGNMEQIDGSAQTMPPHHSNSKTPLVQGKLRRR